MGEKGRISINLWHYRRHSTLSITSSMCSVRSKIFKSVICQHYATNTRLQVWCPIRHFAFHFAWPHIHHEDLTWPFVVPAGRDLEASVCDFSTAEQTCKPDPREKLSQMGEIEKNGEKRKGRKLQQCGEAFNCFPSECDPVTRGVLPCSSVMG